jgi:hypothetical protein
VLAEKEAEEEELAEDNWPVTSDEAKRSARKRGAREDRQETQPHENGAQSPARAGKGVRKTRRSGDKSHTRKRRAA